MSYEFSNLKNVDGNIFTSNEKDINCNLVEQDDSERDIRFGESQIFSDWNSNNTKNTLELEDKRRNQQIIKPILKKLRSISCDFKKKIKIIDKTFSKNGKNAEEQKYVHYKEDQNFSQMILSK